MSLLDRLVVWSLPLAPKALVSRFARRYVAGENIVEMLTVVRTLNNQGIRATVDVLGEFITTRQEALTAANLYKQVLTALTEDKRDANISVKLSQMGLLIDPEFCYEVMDDLVRAAANTGNFVRIDMEDSPCTDATIGLYLRLREKHTNVGIVLQAYLRRTLDDAQRITRAGAGHFRLCKGIYVEPRSVAHQTHALIEKNYALILESMFRENAYVGIATHNENLVWEACRLIDQMAISPTQYEFQMLLGVDPALRNRLVKAGHPIRVYVPFGEQWYAYCMRRLKENPGIAWHILRNLFQREAIQNAQ